MFGRKKKRTSSKSARKTPPRASSRKVGSDARLNGNAASGTQRSRVTPSRKSRTVASRRRKSSFLRKSRVASYIVVAAAATLVGALLGRYEPGLNPPANASVAAELAMQPTVTKEKVMVVGGSIAQGRKDPSLNSYIRRAFAGLTKSTDANYGYSDRTKLGDTAASQQAKRPTEFESWLKADKPTVVVMSWGLESDIYDKTPISAFDAAIRKQIEESLQTHAVVLVVTPPVVYGLAIGAHQKAEEYISAEMNLVKRMHNPNVYSIDLFNQMMAYMKAHHQTYKIYYGDNWHPNTLGHEVGGQLLYGDLVHMFGQTPIHFKG